MCGISLGKLLILGCIIALVFGTKKLRSIEEDAGYALRAFQKAMREDASPAHDDYSEAPLTGSSEERHTDKSKPPHYG